MAFNPDAHPRVPPTRDIFLHTPKEFREGLKQYLVWREGARQQVLKIPGVGILVPGRFASQQAIAWLDKLYDGYAEITLRTRLEELYHFTAREAISVSIDTSGVGKALFEFVAVLEEEVDAEIDKAIELLFRTGRALLQGDGREGRWWKAEHGIRPGARETGKLFGDEGRNVVEGKKFKSGSTAGFIWPDPQLLNQAEHWERVEFGDKKSYQIKPGFMFPFHRSGTTPTDSRYFPGKKGAPNAQAKSVGNRTSATAQYVGPKKGVVGTSKNREKGIFRATEAIVLGPGNAKNLYEKFDKIADRAVERLEKEL